LLHIGICCKSLASQVFKCSEDFEINGAHTSTRTCDWLWCHSWELMDHPPYSPDLEPVISTTLDPLRLTTHADVKQPVICLQALTPICFVLGWRPWWHDGTCA